MINNQAQTILEYVLLIGIATLALVFMGTDMRRGIQSVVKVTADQLGNQVNSDQDFSQRSGQGVLSRSTSNVAQSQRKSTRQAGGVITYDQEETTQTFTNTLTNINNPDN